MAGPSTGTYTFDPQHEFARHIRLPVPERTDITKEALDRAFQEAFRNSTPVQFALRVQAMVGTKDSYLADYQSTALNAVHPTSHQEIARLADIQARQEIYQFCKPYSQEELDQPEDADVQTFAEVVGPRSLLAYMVFASRSNTQAWKPVLDTINPRFLRMDRENYAERQKQRNRSVFDPTRNNATRRGRRTMTATTPVASKRRSDDESSDDGDTLNGADGAAVPDSPARTLVFDAPASPSDTPAAPHTRNQRNGATTTPPLTLTDAPNTRRIDQTRIVLDLSDICFEYSDGEGNMRWLDPLQHEYDARKAKYMRRYAEQLAHNTLFELVASDQDVIELTLAPKLLTQLYVAWDTLKSKRLNNLRAFMVQHTDLLVKYVAYSEMIDDLFTRRRFGLDGTYRRLKRERARIAARIRRIPYVAQPFPKRARTTGAAGGVVRAVRVVGGDGSSDFNSPESKSSTARESKGHPDDDLTNIDETGVESKRAATGNANPPADGLTTPDITTQPRRSRWGRLGDTVREIVGRRRRGRTTRSTNGSTRWRASPLW